MLFNGTWHPWNIGINITISCRLGFRGSRPRWRLVCNRLIEVLRGHTCGWKGGQRLESSWCSQKECTCWPWGAPVAVVDLGATTKSSPSSTICSRFPFPLASTSCLQGLLGDVTQALNPGGSTPGYHALLRPGLLHLSIYCQNWTREHQATLKCIVCTRNVVLLVPIVNTTPFFWCSSLITSAKVMTLLACWSFDKGAWCSGILPHLAYGSEHYS